MGSTLPGLQPFPLWGDTGVFQGVWVATSKPIISVNGKEGREWHSGRADGTCSSCVSVLNVAPDRWDYTGIGLKPHLCLCPSRLKLKKFMAVTAAFCGGSEKLWFFA